MKKKKSPKNIAILNKKARFHYEILERYTAGIALLGTEIKSIRMGKASFSEAYCRFKGPFLLLKGLHISPYTWARENHDPLRERILLLTKKELKKLKKFQEEKRQTIVPLDLFINQKGKAKVTIALGRGKNIADKRQSIKEKELKRRAQSGWKNP